MFRVRWLCASAFLICFCAILARSQNPIQREKVAEGEYAQWKDGHPLKDTSQTWTIWRTPNGYEVEDTLPPDQGAALAAVVGAALEKNMTPELQEEYRKATTATEIHLQLSKEGAIRGMLLNGKTLADVKQVQVANCTVSENEIACKGHNGSAHLKNSSQDQLVYAYPFPLFFTPLLRQSKPAQNETASVKLAMVELVKNKLQLTEVRGELQSEGRHKLSVGDYNFDADKYDLTLNTRSGQRQVKLWAGNQGTIFAMEDSELAAGLRIMVTQYKRYYDF